MSTHPPTLTTQELLDAFVREQVAVSVTQLTRWVREGLIPAALRTRRGRGRGKGAEWLWDWECLPRAVIIARTLASGDPSLQRAAEMLARAGYAPSAERLRTALLNGIDAFERVVTHREPYLKQHDMPVSEKRRRLNRNLKRKGPDLPDTLLATVTTFAHAIHNLGGADNTGSSEVVNAAPDRGLGQHISLDALRHAIEEVSGSDLLAAHEQAGRMLPLALPTVVTLFNALALPFLADRLNHRGKPAEDLPRSFDVAAILGDMKEADGRVTCSPENPASWIRLYFTVMLAAVKVQGEGIMEDIAAPIFDLQNVIMSFAQQRGFPGADALPSTIVGGPDSI